MAQPLNHCHCLLGRPGRRKRCGIAPGHEELPRRERAKGS